MKKISRELDLNVPVFLTEVQISTAHFLWIMTVADVPVGKEGHPSTKHVFPLSAWLYHSDFSHLQSVWHHTSCTLSEVGSVETEPSGGLTDLCHTSWTPRLSDSWLWDITHADVSGSSSYVSHCLCCDSETPPHESPQTFHCTPACSSSQSLDLPWIPSAGKPVCTYLPFSMEVLLGCPSQIGSIFLMTGMGWLSPSALHGKPPWTFEAPSHCAQHILHLAWANSKLCCLLRPKAVHSLQPSVLSHIIFLMVRHKFCLIFRELFWVLPFSYKNE